MSQVNSIEAMFGDWTAADLVQRFGPIPLHRVRSEPPPGQAREDDVLRIHAREGRLCELVDKTLVEKTVGTFESYLAVALASLLHKFVTDNHLGIVLGADGMMRFAPGLIRIPDVSFISWSRMPAGGLEQQPIADIIPNLAIEVISQSNTREEMDRKLNEYFQFGVEVVWYIYPQSQEVVVYTSSSQSTTLREPQSLDGGAVLPGLELSITDIFAKPGK